MSSLHSTRLPENTIVKQLSSLNPDPFKKYYCVCGCRSVAIASHIKGVATQIKSSTKTSVNVVKSAKLVKSKCISKFSHSRHFVSAGLKEAYWT